MTVDAPILNIERELIICLDDQARGIKKTNCATWCRSMLLPFADVADVAETPFVNFARRAWPDEPTLLNR